MAKENTIEIVLVEDNPHDAELALRAFKKNNLANSVIHLKDGEEALDFLYCRGEFEGRPAGLPKLMLLDLNLPKIDGHEVLKKMKEDPHLRVIPVVVLTSSKEEKDMLKSYRTGANSYMVKPVGFSKFIDVVKDLGFYWLVLNQLPDTDLG
jgi:two-component system, response regulator